MNLHLLQNLAIQVHVALMPFVRNAIMLDHVNVYQNIRAIHILDVVLNVL